MNRPLTDSRYRPLTDSRFFTIEVDSVKAEVVNVLLMSSLRGMCDTLVCLNSEWSGYTNSDERVMYQILGTEEQLQACKKKIRRLSRGRPKFDIVFNGMWRRHTTYPSTYRSII